MELVELNVCFGYKLALGEKVNFQNKFVRCSPGFVSSVRHDMLYTVFRVHRTFVYINKFVEGPYETV